jgi:hypothetical protein
LKIHNYIFHSAVLKKQFSAITNLAHLCFAKNRQIIKELNCFPQKLGVLSAQFCASHIRSVKGAVPAAAWYFFIKILIL